MHVDATNTNGKVMLCQDKHLTFLETFLTFSVWWRLTCLTTPHPPLQLRDPHLTILSIWIVDIYKHPLEQDPSNG